LAASVKDLDTGASPFGGLSDLRIEVVDAVDESEHAVQLWPRPRPLLHNRLAIFDHGTKNLELSNGHQLVNHRPDIVPIRPSGADLPVHGQTVHLLARGSIHEPRFPRIDREAAAGDDVLEGGAGNPQVGLRRLVAEGPGDLGRELILACGEREVVGVPRVGAPELVGELHQPHVEDVGDQIGNDRGTRAALRQRVVMAGDLGDNGGDLLIEREVAVLEQESSNPAEIDGWEKSSGSRVFSISDWQSWRRSASFR
jgi:hypothetical protein